MKTAIGCRVQGMENQMETVIMGCIEFRVQGLEFKRWKRTWKLRSWVI